MSSEKFSCVACGCVHAGITQAEAQAQVDLVNLTGTLPLASLNEYLRCFECGASSRDFVPAALGSTYPLQTLQTVIAPLE